MGRGAAETGAEESTKVALVWAAAAAAREFTAAAHSLAACVFNRTAAEAEAEATAADRDTAEAGYNAVGRDGRLNGAALADAATPLRAAVRAQRRAGAAFREAAAHTRSSAAEFAMAAAAHAMAGDAAREQALRGRADAARAMIRDADRRASLAGRAARVARAALRRWTEAADGMPDGAVYPGGRAAWTGEQESMRADAERDRAGWSGRARRAAADVRAAGDYMRECADAADRAAAAAAKGENGVGLADTPDARAAAAAWNEAVAAARNAANECGSLA